MRKSTRTCRLQGLGSDVTEDRLNQLAEDLCAKPRGLKTSVKASLNSVSQTFGLSHGDQSPVILGTNLTIRDNVQTATITYNSQTKKQRATKSFRPSNECANVDDEFEGVTVLYGGNEMPIDLDICAVHGLDGHAFDTWMAKTKMWLRDYLPHEFPKSRIMTFGYNSNLMDGKSINHGLKDFADSLIDGLKFVRATDDEKRRPVLFICHSMGGFVSRLAVTRHWRWRGEGMKYKSVKFVNYGFLFLSTPHSGTNLANFSDLALDFASLMAGVRTKLVEELR
ncbi:hypothetical protein BGZ61DRAFT_391426, partial [Ilyonectria robusta]|uniref:uncharacterized protein n=1 Tax=Ilyonectria robusta TaxID=1079257 RepID=UPI001E8CE218